MQIFGGLIVLASVCYEYDWEPATSIFLVLAGLLPPFLMLADRLWRGVMGGALAGWVVATVLSLVLLWSSDPASSPSGEDWLNAAWLGLCLGVPLGSFGGGLLESRLRNQKRRQAA